MASSRPRPAPPYRFGAFELDLARQELRRHGVLLPLRPQPLRVLACLLRRPGELVTREELQREVWGDTFVDFDQGLNSCIRQIRSVLGDSAVRPRFIETLPRRGYRFHGSVQATPSAPAPGPAAPWLRVAPAVLLSLALLHGLGHPAVDSRHARAIEARGTARARAFDLYLLGRHELSRRMEPGFERAIEYFRAAVDDDPGFARAWAAIAEAHLAWADHHLVAPAEAYRRADEAARQALALDPLLAEAHACAGRISWGLSRNAPRAEASLRRALRLEPRSSDVILAYVWFLVDRGRFTEARAHNARALELDPLSSQAHLVEALLRDATGDVAGAWAELQPTLELDPSLPSVHHHLALAYSSREQFSDALRAAETAARLSGRAPKYLSALGTAYARAGQRHEAERVLLELRQLASRRYVDRAFIERLAGNLASM